MVPFSVLDLAPVVQGATATDALRHSLELAWQAEGLNYRRFWLAEHHNIVGIASAATAVVIGYVAGGTKKIRVGSGGIMLPNHSPLVIAEQFGTLASLYPGRIDLGIGRAPGTDPLTARALRRDAHNAENYPNDVVELQQYFEPIRPGQKIRAVPGAGLDVPLWILGSSLFSAELAARLGLPYAFASHFAPDQMLPAFNIYRTHFQPSKQLDRPYSMACLNVVAADSDAEARHHFTSLQQAVVNMQRGTRGLVPPPIDDIHMYWSPLEQAGTERMLQCSAVGGEETVEKSIRSFLAATEIDELMITAHIHNQAARLRSLEIAARIRDRI